MHSWHAKIEDADNPMDVLAVARDYLAGWAPEDLALLPEWARPLQLKGLDDIAYWHQRLVECYCTGAAKGRENAMVRDMLHFFAFAIQRAAELDGEPPIDEHEAAARLFSERSVPRLFTSAMMGRGDS